MSNPDVIPTDRTCSCCGDELGVPVEQVPPGMIAHIMGTEGDCPQCAENERNYEASRGSRHRAAFDIIGVACGKFGCAHHEGHHAYAKPHGCMIDGCACKAFVDENEYSRALAASAKCDKSCNHNE